MSGGSAQDDRQQTGEKIRSFRVFIVAACTLNKYAGAATAVGLSAN